MKVPGITEKLADEVVEVVQGVRKLDLKKGPSISETLDWAKALTLLNVEQLDESVVNDTLNTILKYEGDVKKAEAELKEFCRKEKKHRAKAGEAEEKTSSIKAKWNDHQGSEGYGRQNYRFYPPPATERTESVCGGEYGYVLGGGVNGHPKPPGVKGHLAGDACETGC